MTNNRDLLIKNLNCNICKLKKKLGNLDINSNLNYFDFDYKELEIDNIHYFSDYLTLRIVFKDLSKNMKYTSDNLKGEKKYKLINTDLFLNTYANLIKKYDLHICKSSILNNKVCFNNGDGINSLSPFSIIVNNKIYNFYITDIQNKNNNIEFNLLQMNENIDYYNSREKHPHTSEQLHTHFKSLKIGNLRNKEDLNELKLSKNGKCFTVFIGALIAAVADAIATAATATAVAVSAVTEAATSAISSIIAAATESATDAAVTDAAETAVEGTEAAADTAASAADAADVTENAAENATNISEIENAENLESNTEDGFTNENEKLAENLKNIYIQQYSFMSSFKILSLVALTIVLSVTSFIGPIIKAIKCDESNCGDITQKSNTISTLNFKPMILKNTNSKIKDSSNINDTILNDKLSKAFAQFNNNLPIGNTNSSSSNNSRNNKYNFRNKDYIKEKNLQILKVKKTEIKDIKLLKELKIKINNLKLNKSILSNFNSICDLLITNFNLIISNDLILEYDNNGDFLSKYKLDGNISSKLNSIFKEDKKKYVILGLNKENNKPNYVLDDNSNIKCDYFNSNEAIIDNNDILYFDINSANSCYFSEFTIDNLKLKLCSFINFYNKLFNDLIIEKNIIKQCAEIINIIFKELNIGENVNINSIDNYDKIFSFLDYTKKVIDNESKNSLQNENKDFNSVNTNNALLIEDEDSKKVNKVSNYSKIINSIINIVNYFNNLLKNSVELYLKSIKIFNNLVNKYQIFTLNLEDNLVLDYYNQYGNFLKNDKYSFSKFYLITKLLIGKYEYSNYIFRYLKFSDISEFIYNKTFLNNPIDIYKILDYNTFSKNSINEFVKYNNLINTSSNTVYVYEHYNNINVLIKNSMFLDYIINKKTINYRKPESNEQLLISIIDDCIGKTTNFKDMLTNIEQFIYPILENEFKIEKEYINFEKIDRSMLFFLNKYLTEKSSKKFKDLVSLNFIYNEYKFYNFIYNEYFPEINKYKYNLLTDKNKLDLNKNAKNLVDKFFILITKNNISFKIYPFKINNNDIKISYKKKYDIKMSYNLYLKYLYFFQKIILKILNHILTKYKKEEITISKKQVKIKILERYFKSINKIITYKKYNYLNPKILDKYDIPLVDDLKSINIDKKLNKYTKLEDLIKDCLTPYIVISDIFYNEHKNFLKFINILFKNDTSSGTQYKKINDIKQKYKINNENNSKAIEELIKNNKNVIKSVYIENNADNLNKSKSFVLYNYKNKILEVAYINTSIYLVPPNIISYNLSSDKFNKLTEYINNKDLLLMNDTMKKYIENKEYDIYILFNGLKIKNFNKSNYLVIVLQNKKFVYIGSLLKKI